MSEDAIWIQGAFMTAEDELEREFEARLVESTTLAFRVAFGVLRHREDAEEVAQEALVKAYRGFRQLRDRERFRAWLVRTTWRLAINRRRSDMRRRSREALHVESLSEPTASQAMEGSERSRQLWSAIDSLPEKLQAVIVLAGIEGHDLRKVSLLLRLPIGTVKSRLFLARQRLKELLRCKTTF